jgi:hypothetical protein
MRERVVGLPVREASRRSWSAKAVSRALPGSLKRYRLDVQLSQ